MRAPITPAPDWSRRLKLHHLDIFRSLIECGSMTAAAKAMHVTQPALSHWLKELEEAVGVALVTRGRRLLPTPAGEVFLGHARRMLGDAARTREEIDSIRAGAVGRVRVGVVLVAAPALVPLAFAQLQRELPRLTLSLVEGTLDQLLARMHQHELDLIVGRLDKQALNSGFQHARLYDEAARIVSRIGHPLTRRRRLDWREVAAYPWIVPAPGTPMRLHLEAAFAKAGLPLPQARIESAAMLANQTVLSTTDYLAALSQSAASHFERLGLLTCLPLQIRDGLGSVGMLWGQGETGPLLQRVLDALVEQAQHIRQEVDQEARTPA